MPMLANQTELAILINKHNCYKMSNIKIRRINVFTRGIS